MIAWQVVTKHTIVISALERGGHVGRHMSRINHHANMLASFLFVPLNILRH
jgi:hypothetical protein